MLVGAGWGLIGWLSRTWRIPLSVCVCVGVEGTVGVFAVLLFNHPIKSHQSGAFFICII